MVPSCAHVLRSCGFWATRWYVQHDGVASHFVPPSDRPLINGPTERVVGRNYYCFHVRCALFAEDGGQITSSKGIGCESLRGLSLLRRNGMCGCKYGLSDWRSIEERRRGKDGATRMIIPTTRRRKFWSETIWQ